jgi:hypothetical protein
VFLNAARFGAAFGVAAEKKAGEKISPAIDTA